MHDRGESAATVSAKSVVPQPLTSVGISQASLINQSPLADVSYLD